MKPIRQSLGYLACHGTRGIGWRYGQYHIDSSFHLVAKVFNGGTYDLLQCILVVSIFELIQKLSDLASCVVKNWISRFVLTNYLTCHRMPIEHDTCC